METYSFRELQLDCTRCTSEITNFDQIAVTLQNVEIDPYEFLDNFHPDTIIEYLLTSIGGDEEKLIDLLKTKCVERRENLENEFLRGVLIKQIDKIIENIKILDSEYKCNLPPQINYYFLDIPNLLKKIEEIKKVYVEVQHSTLERI